jgi:cobalt-zinc-cadmium efflux system outer membrane protein
MFVRAFLLFLVACSSFPSFAQEAHQHHQHGAAGAASPDASARLQPQLAPDADAYEVDGLLDAALSSNPTVEQAAEVIARAEGLRKQAGKYPNPTVGVTGDENSPNATLRGGEIGVFVEQRIVTAGKLGLDRDIASQEAIQARAVDAAQRQSVRNSVRKHFYEALGAQWELDVHRRLLEMTEEAARITGELANVGQADQPDVLRGEIEAQRSSIELRQAQNKANRAWTQLALAIGHADLARKPLRGNMEEYPRLDEGLARSNLLQQSPQVAIARAEVDRSNYAVERARIEKWPDIKLHGGVRDSPLLGRDGRPTGREGFFDVGIELPIFDRRKGAVQAARADARRAELETSRLRLELEHRLAARYQEYADAVAVVEILRDEMLPRAAQAHEAYRRSFERMAAAYPQVLVARRNLLELEKEYAAALMDVWDSAIDIEGLLLSRGLAAPAPPGSASELMDSDRPLTPTALRRHR